MLLYLLYRTQVCSTHVPTLSATKAKATVEKNHPALTRQKSRTHDFRTATTIDTVTAVAGTIQYNTKQYRTSRSTPVAQ